MSLLKYLSEQKICQTNAADKNETFDFMPYKLSPLDPQFLGQLTKGMESARTGMYAKYIS
jgi:hypothetical protein